MSIFGHPVGVCDRCGANGLKLYEYGGQDVCAACRDILRDYDRVGSIEDAYQSIHNVIEHANTNYPSSA